MVAIINLNHASGMVNVEIEGKYFNMMTKENVTINKYLTMSEDALILLRKK